MSYEDFVEGGRRVSAVASRETEELRQRIRELEDERDIFARTLDKRDEENNRLREALEHIAMLEKDFMSDPIGNAGVDHDKARVARKALEE